MENIAIAQQIVDLNRVTADNIWNGITLLQNQTERVVKAYFARGGEAVTEGRKVLEEWTKAFTQGQEAIQAVVEENQVSIEQFFQPPQPTKPAAKTKKAK